MRRSSRVALFDPTGSVLLVRSRFRRSVPGAEWAWFLPGGGIEPGESAREAAIREVHEETGLDIQDQPLTHVAFAEGHGTVGDLVGPMRDEVFAARVPSTSVVTDGMEAHELDALDHFRWWDLSDLRETTELVFPVSLAVTLDHFQSAQEWPEPIPLPWYAPMEDPD